jgi:hypothetical protein
MASFVIGGLILLACVGLIVVGFIFLPDQIAQLQGETATPTTPEATEIAVKTPVPAPSPTSTPTTEVVSSSPIETPPAVATDTPTPAPTDTPLPTPTETPTSVPTTPPPPPTDTPTAEPTATPIPTATNTPASASAATPTPAPTPTTGFRYPAPKLVSPESDFDFIAGNTIDLIWEPVGELAGNEQYAVRVVYFHNAEVVYRGTNLKETQWTVPLQLYHDADGPEFKHTWYVYVEEVQPDGTGIPISPESESRSFTWD